MEGAKGEADPEEARSSCSFESDGKLGGIPLQDPPDATWGIGGLPVLKNLDLEPPLPKETELSPV